MPDMVLSEYVVTLNLSNSGKIERKLYYSKGLCEYETDWNTEFTRSLMDAFRTQDEYRIVQSINSIASADLDLPPLGSLYLVEGEAQIQNSTTQGVPFQILLELRGQSVRVIGLGPMGFVALCVEEPQVVSSVPIFLITRPELMSNVSVHTALVESENAASSIGADTQPDSPTVRDQKESAVAADVVVQGALSVRKSGYSTASAFSVAERALPAGAKIISKRVLVEPVEVSRTDIYAYEYDEAEKKAEALREDPEHVVHTRTVATGSKGVLWFGRKKGHYQAIVVSTPAEVEITYVPTPPQVIGVVFVTKGSLRDQDIRTMMREVEEQARSRGYTIAPGLKTLTVVTGFGPYGAGPDRVWDTIRGEFGWNALAKSIHFILRQSRSTDLQVLGIMDRDMTRKPSVE